GERLLVHSFRAFGPLGNDEVTLAGLVSRDAMIGTAVARRPESDT
ncbi:nitrile hydratase subunit alpha, partial [Rhizobium ruizarguesonis]